MYDIFWEIIMIPLGDGNSGNVISILPFTLFKRFEKSSYVPIQANIYYVLCHGERRRL